MERWKKELILGGPGYPSKEFRLRKVGEETVLESRSTLPQDVTKECTVELVKSHSSEGYYVKILHGNTRVSILGLGKPITNSEYSIRKAEGATLSFRIFREN